MRQPAPRPQKTFKAAWISCGYFQSDEFPESEPMSQQEAIATLDETGMLQTMGIASDIAGEALSPDRPNRGPNSWVYFWRIFKAHICRMSWELLTI